MPDSLAGTLAVGLQHYLILSAMLFCLGLFGVLMRRNVLVILMSIELMLNAVNLSLISFGRFNGQVDGQILVFFVMTVAAAEAGVGLALAVTVYKKFKEVNIKSFEQLRG
jgi:NADH-quinone oxidoreductase subunit K